MKPQIKRALSLSIFAAAVLLLTAAVPSSADARSHVLMHKVWSFFQSSSFSRLPGISPSLKAQARAMTSAQIQELLNHTPDLRRRLEESSTIEMSPSDLSDLLESLNAKPSTHNPLDLLRPKNVELTCEARVQDGLPPVQQRVYSVHLEDEGRSRAEIARILLKREGWSKPEIEQMLEKKTIAVRNALHHARNTIFEKCTCREATASALLRNARSHEERMVFGLRRKGLNYSDIDEQTRQHYPKVSSVEISNMVQDFDSAVEMNCGCVPKTMRDGEQLEKPERTVARLARMEGLKADEIAAKLKMSVNKIEDSLETVRMRLRAACGETVALIPGEV